MNTAPPPFGDCGTGAHFSRRNLLRTAGLAGMGWLTPLSRKLAIGAERSGKRPRSVIVLWLQGGASQVETFDPHPGGSVAFGSTAIPTSVKGIQLGSGLPRLAERMGHVSVIRSVTSKEGDHARAIYNTKTGYRPFPGLVHPSIGSVLCHELPPPLSGGEPLDIPTHISILPSAFPARGGYLGARFDAFQVGDPVNPMADVESRVDGRRTRQRLESLDVLERSFAKGRIPDLEQTRTLHRASIRNARKMMSSEQLSAFDVEERPRAERQAYGNTSFGRGCLAALGLIETGVRCVEVTLNGWDTHINNHEGHAKLNAVLDPAVSALVDGLIERDLYDETVILVGTEFGRTPKLNVTEGRDHWPHGFSVLIGGGGLRGGLAIGETDPAGEKDDPADPVRVEDIHATILHQLGVDHEYELDTPIGRPLPISEGKRIHPLL